MKKGKSYRCRQQERQIACQSSEKMLASQLQPSTQSQRVAQNGAVIREPTPLLTCSSALAFTLPGRRLNSDLPGRLLKDAESLAESEHKGSLRIKAQHSQKASDLHLTKGQLENIAFCISV
ncbi:hypothetical protein CEXT_73591 [Caerostris extrusa]|uniref:Uncharacterized protein n=1 Tax=Caerostris extrusa TaxID=172846 RepID=A0AAV4VY40_CAEEX|nr:hypothetical protein CEXT_73591 [Caerostris extrusa]